jgi:tRNA A-37 threonylcarbamoyl transferase component Bud32
VIYYYKTRAGPFTLWLAASFVDSPLGDVLSDGLRSLVKIYSVKRVPASATSEVCTFEYEGETFYFKQYHCRSLWDVIKHLVRPSRAERAMQAAAMLQANSFAAPEIVAMGCCRKGIFNLENFLLTREVKNALSLYAFLQLHYGGSNSCSAEKRKFIKAVGHIVGRLHAKNISHGDLRLGNVLVRKNSETWDFFFLDNERTVQYVRLPDRLRLKNLVQCNMDLSPALMRTDRLRFFAAYLAENPTLANAAKTWLKKINRRTFRRIAKRTKKDPHKKRM